MPFKTPHPLYGTWQAMKRRCDNRNNPSYINYGGRGIAVCDRWINDFHAFASDMGERPEGLTLERKDNNKGYSPSNCKWATRSEQQLNRRDAVFVTIEGREYRPSILAKKAGVKNDTIIDRAKKGLPMSKVMQKEPMRDLSGLALGGKANGQRQKNKTHCPYGHEYTPDNILKNPHSWRRCKTCHRIKEAKRRNS